MFPSLSTSTMADTAPFLPISSPPPETHRDRRKSLILKFMFSLTLSLTLLVLLLGYENRKSTDQFQQQQQDDDEDDVKSSSSNHTRGNVDLKTGKPRERLSRGVSAGVSEKSSPVSRSGGMPEFVWNNSVLSWQRTAFHFQPEKNWMNDPNGPLFYKGWYHFFYQYNPNAPIWGDMVWGHAVSRDLIHWFHLPLAMEANQWYEENGIWTGSATLLPDGRIIMLYTGATNESIQVQNLAYPSDPNDPLLLKWTKYPGNPVLLPPPGIDVHDFRDPTTAWYTSEGKWRISIGSRINSTGVALVYDTRDFINYEMSTERLHGVTRTGMWECVDFFPVSTSNDNGLDTSVNRPDVRHVMKASLDDDRHDYYAIGTYDEKNVKWYPDDPTIDVGIGIRYDYGVFYAAKTFYDPLKKRRILWGWISESDSEVADLKKGWASLQGIPRTIFLDRKTGGNLLQWPVEEVESLRSRSQTFNNVKLKTGSVVPLDLDSGTQLDIEAEFEIDKAALEKAAASNEDEFSCSSHGGANLSGALGPFGLIVLADDSLTERTPVYFYIFKGHNGELKTFFCTDQSRSSAANNVDKHIYGSYVPVLKDERFSMRILVDHSIIESFAQGGRSCITSRVYPTRAIHRAAKLFLFNNAIEANVTASLKIWQMNAASITPYSGGYKFH